MFNVPTLRVPVGKFSPRGRSVLTMPSGNTLWLSGDSGTYAVGGGLATADSTPITQWVDRSGSFWTFDQVTGANQPKLRTGANGINNLPIVQFDGTNDVLLGSGQLSQFIQASAYTLYVVGRMTSIPTDSTSVTNANGAWICDGSAARWGLYSLSGGETRMFNWDGTDDRASRATTTGVVYGMRGSHGSGTLRLIRNGLAEGTTASGNTTSLTGTLEIGRGNGTICLGVDIAEIILFNVDLATADRSTVESYLASKWGFTW